MRAPSLGTFALALANLKRKPARTVSLCVIVGLFAFTLSGGSILNANLSQGLAALSGRMGADILIVPHGYEKNIQAAILRGEPSEFYIKADVTEKIRAEHFVEAASPQLFLASLSSGCCTAKVQLVGFDTDTDFSVQPWMQQQLRRPLAENEVVVGSMIVPGPGETVQFFGKSFTIAAKMERTGMGFDTSVFMTMAAAHALMQDAELVNGDREAIRDYISSVMVKVREGFAVKDAANALMRSHAIDYDLDMVVAANMLTAIASGIHNISLLLFGLACVLWVVALITLFTVFSAGQSERQRELAILRILGATRAKLARLVLTEALLVSVAGALGGILLAAIVVFPFNSLIFASLQLPFVALSLLQVLGYVAATLVAATIIGPLASAWTAFSITRFDVYATLREGE